MESHLFAVLNRVCGAKLDPQAFRSASITMTVHKSQIINLRKMSCVLHPWQLRLVSVSVEAQRTRNERETEKAENN